MVESAATSFHRSARAPWGTGPSTLAEGYSRLNTEEAIVSESPFAATWLWRQDRTPRVRLTAKDRGPHLRDVVFRNDLSPADALDLVCTTEGEIDIVTEVSPADAPTLELHRAFVGDTGEYRAGPIVPEFEELWTELIKETSQAKQGLTNNRIDKLIYDEALALFLCAPQALYAVNKHIDFKPYHTSFELAETKFSDKHWSRR